MNFKIGDINVSHVSVIDDSRIPLMFKNKKGDIVYSIKAINIDGTVADGFQLKRVDNGGSEYRSIAGRHLDDLDLEDRAQEWKNKILSRVGLR